MSKRSLLELLADMSAVVEGNPAKAIRMAADEIVSLREQVEKLTAALKLSREALSDAMEWCIRRDSNFYKPCEEALAAIAALGEVK